MKDDAVEVEIDESESVEDVERESVLDESTVETSVDTEETGSAGY